MRVAIVSHRPLGVISTGGGRIIRDLAVGLRERGLHVDVYSLSRKGLGCPRDDYFRNIECVEISEDLLRKILLLPSRALSLASKEALLFIKLMIQFDIDRISKLYKDLMEIICSRNYDLAILETTYLSHLGHMLSLKGLPSMLRIHNVEAEYIASLSYKSLREFVFRSMQRIERKVLEMINNRVTISMRDKEIISKLYRLETVYLGPTVKGSKKDCSRKDQNNIESLGLECGRYALYVGSSHKPNIIAVNNILQSIKKDNIKITLVIVGEVGRYIRKNSGNIGYVKILNFVPDEVLRSLYCCAAISLAPIFSGSGVPIKLIESLLYEVPTITSRKAELMIPGLKHLENVIILERIGNISEALKNLYKDEDLREKVSRGARLLVEKSIGFEKTIERYYAYMTKLTSFSL